MPETTRIGRGFHNTGDSQFHAIGRRARNAVAIESPAAVDGNHLQGVGQGYGMAHRGLLGHRGDHHHLADLFQGLLDEKQTLGIDPVIIGQKETHERCHNTG